MDDLRKVRVPEGALRIEIDDPQSLRITKPVGVLRGWFATRDGELPETCTFRIGGMTLPYQMVRRMDVEELMPEHSVRGFEIPYNLSDYLPYIQDNLLVVRLMLAEYAPFVFRFRIDSSALGCCLASAGGV